MNSSGIQSLGSKVLQLQAILDQVRTHDPKIEEQLLAVALINTDPARQESLAWSGVEPPTMALLGMALSELYAGEHIQGIMAAYPYADQLTIQHHMVVYHNGKPTVSHVFHPLAIATGGAPLVLAFAFRGTVSRAALDFVVPMLESKLMDELRS